MQLFIVNRWECGQTNKCFGIVLNVLNPDCSSSNTEGIHVITDRNACNKGKYNLFFTKLLNYQYDEHVCRTLIWEEHGISTLDLLGENKFYFISLVEVKNVLPKKYHFSN